MKCCTAGRIGGCALLHAQRRYIYPDCRTGLRTIHLYPSCDLLGFCSRKLERIVLNKRLRYFDQLHAARQPAIVPPIGVNAGNAIGAPRVVHLNDDTVLTFHDYICDLKIEWRVSANVLSEFLAIQPDSRLVIGRTEIKECTDVLSFLIRKISLVPHGAFIKQE